MTKDNPDELCPACRKFDRGINGGPASCDVFVVCDHDVKPKAKDYCAGCEYPELLHMMLPRIEELEKQVHKLSKKKCIDADILLCIDYKIHELEKGLKALDESTEGCDAIQLKRIIELEKRVNELELNQSRLAHEITKWSISQVELSTKLKAAIEIMTKKLDAKTDI